MTRKKFSLEFDGLEEMIKQFNYLEEDLIPVGTKALEATHSHITPKIHEKVQRSNLPAGGKYSTSGRLHSESQIIDDVNIEWKGLNGTVDIGFSLDKTIVPIFFMYGSPKGQNMVKGLRNAIYGSQTKEEIAKIQQDIFAEELEKAWTKKV